MIPVREDEIDILADLQRRVRDLEARQASAGGTTGSHVLLRGADAFGTYEHLASPNDMNATLPRTVATEANRIRWAEIPQNFTHLLLRYVGAWGGVAGTVTAHLVGRFHPVGGAWVANAGLNFANPSAWAVYNLNWSGNSGIVGEMNGAGTNFNVSAGEIEIPWYARPIKHPCHGLAHLWPEQTPNPSPRMIVFNLTGHLPIEQIELWCGNASGQWNAYTAFELWGIGPVESPVVWPAAGDPLLPTPTVPPAPAPAAPKPVTPPQVTQRVATINVPAGSNYSGTVRIAGANVTVPRAGKIHVWGDLSGWMYAWRNDVGAGVGTRKVRTRYQGVNQSGAAVWPGSTTNTTVTRNDTWACSAGTRALEWYCEMAGGNVFRCTGGHLYADWTGPAW